MTSTQSMQSMGGDLSRLSAVSWKAKLAALVRDAPDDDPRVAEARAGLSYWRREPGGDVPRLGRTGCRRRLRTCCAALALDTRLAQLN
jgi:hypothetical protein